MMQECAENALKIHEAEAKERAREQRRKMRAEGKVPGMRGERGRGGRGPKPERGQRKIEDQIWG